MMLLIPIYICLREPTDILLCINLCTRQITDSCKSVILHVVQNVPESVTSMHICICGVEMEENADKYYLVLRADCRFMSKTMSYILVYFSIAVTKH